MPLFDTHPEESLFHVVKDLKEDVTTLIRQEIALAKRDISAKVKGVGASAAFFAVAAVIGVFAAFFLCLFLNNIIGYGLVALGLSASISGWLAPLSVALLLAVGGLLSALKALKALRSANPADPESWRAVQSVKKLKDVRPHAHPAPDPRPATSTKPAPAGKKG